MPGTSSRRNWRTPVEGEHRDGAAARASRVARDLQARTSPAIRKSPLSGRAWANLKRSTVSFQNALPTALRTCFLVSSVLSGELYPTGERERKLERLRVTERRFVQVALNRELKELLAALERQFPQIHDENWDLSQATERRALRKIGRLRQLIRQKLQQGNHRGQGQQQKRPEVVQECGAGVADDRTAGGLSFFPGGFCYGECRYRLGGKPLQVLQALAEAVGNTITLDDLNRKIWQGSIVGQETMRSAVKAARRALRNAIQATGADGPEDPIPVVDRGPGRTAWRLDLS